MQRRRALFEAARAADPALPAKKLANWVTGEYLRLAKGDDADVDVTHISGERLAALVRLVEGGEISGTNAKEVLLRVGREGRSVAEIVTESGFKQISDTGALQAAVDDVIAQNPDAVADIRAGEQKAIGFLTGQIMKKTRGQANAGVVQQLIRESLEVE